MRNTDRIKELEHELGRYQKKVTAQEAQMAGLREQLQRYQGGVAELNRAADALCVAVAVQFGVEAGPGVKEARIAKICTEDIKHGYTLSVRPEDGMYMIRAEMREEPTGIGLRGIG